MDLKIVFVAWGEHQDQLLFTTVAGRPLQTTLEIVDLSGETVFYRPVKIKKGKSVLSVEGVGALLPGSYGYRFGNGRMTGVFQKR